MEEKNIIRIEGIDYNVEIFFENENSESPPIPMRMFHEIFLEEELFKYGFSGYFIYDDTGENLKNIGYEHTSDGSEKISISLTIVSNVEYKTDFTEMLNFKIIGSVVDIEPMNGEGASKLKKVSFIDIYNSKAERSTIPITSVRSLKYKGENVSNNSTNDERSDFFGDIIKYALHELNVPKEKMKYVHSGDFKKFYMSKKDATVNDSIYELLALWSFENVPGMFIYDRITDSFLLIPLNGLFRGEYISEKEILTLNINPNTITKSSTPFIDFETDTQYNMGEYSVCYNFEYTATNPQNNVNIIADMHSHNFDPYSGKFVAINEGNTHTDIISTFNNAMPEGTVANVEVSKDRDKVFKNSKMKIGYGVTYYVSRRIREYIKSLESLKITVKGLPFRRPGTFFIIKDNVDVDDYFNTTIDGEWLCLKVEHRILPNNYENRLMLVKPYVHKYSDKATRLKKKGFSLTEIPINNLSILSTIKNGINTVVNAIGELKDSIVEIPNHDDEINHITTEAIDDVGKKLDETLENKNICHSDRFAMLKNKLSLRIQTVEDAYITVSDHVKDILNGIKEAISNFVSKAFMLNSDDPLMLPVKNMKDATETIKKVQNIISFAKSIIEFVTEPIAILLQLEGKLLTTVGKCLNNFLGSKLDEDLHNVENKITKVKDTYDNIK